MRMLGLALVLTAATAAADTPTRIPERAIPIAEALRDRALAGTPAFDIVEDLTTTVGPRLPGSQADARAVAWAVAKFKALGFDRVWTEPVTIPVWRRGHARAEVVGAFAQPLVITALGGSVGTDGALEAEIAEFPTLQALREAPEGSLAGKIAFISNRMERFIDGSGYGPAVVARSNGAVEAARLGAKAIVIRSIGTNSARFPHTGNMRYVDDVPKIPAAALSNPDADQLLRLLARGQPVRLRLDFEAGTIGEHTTHNVIGEITGRERPDEVVVIGAHLDSWDLGTGALDDGAGIAITMAAGALIGQLDKTQRPRRSVRVIAWGAEEIGLLGAYAYAARHADAITRHLIGAESDFGAGRIYALRAGVKDSAWDAIERIGQVLAPLGIVTERGVGGPGPDIIPLAQRGMAWAQLAQDGSDYFDYHHTPDDTLDKIDPEALDQQVAAYAAFAYLAAEAEGDFGSAPREAVQNR
ncbi:M28 family peptidase [Rehaibacterium terrae]|uniref:M28 family peptidase n=1 Tax=Rehaibacterium terrae TaxID=1341696 RepID=UPI003CCE4586